jgi:hypothetical protein
LIRSLGPRLHRPAPLGRTRSTTHRVGSSPAPGQARHGRALRGRVAHGLALRGRAHPGRVRRGLVRPGRVPHGTELGVNWWN